MGVGSTFVSVGRQFGRENENHITVVEFIPSEKIVFESEGRAGRFRHYFIMKKDGGITSLIKRAEIIQASLALRLLSPIFAALRVTGRVFDGDLRRIKAKLEEVAG